MKKTYTLFLCALFVMFTATAQKKNIRLDIGFQHNMPERIFNRSLHAYDNRGKGLGFHISPRWDYSKKVSLAICMDFNSVRGYYTKQFYGEELWWVSRTTFPYELFSFSPTATYYFTDHKFKPFVALGAGAYYCLYRKPIVNFGIRPAIGISINKIVAISFEYSRIFGNFKSDYYYENSGIYRFNHNILSLKASFSIGLANHYRP